VVKDWEEAFGEEAVMETLSLLRSTVDDIDLLLYTGSLKQSEIPNELAVQIRNPAFFKTDYGKFVRAAMLNGHEVDSERFFKNSGAAWNKSIPVVVTHVSFEGSKDSQNNRLVKLGVTSRGSSFSVVKTADELLKLLY
jgi:hypothetical protein